MAMVEAYLLPTSAVSGFVNKDWLSFLSLISPGITPRFGDI